jgi:hypothetical protein
MNKEELHMKHRVLVIVLMACLACRQGERVAATTSTGSANVNATVIFKGLIAHFRDSYQRAAIVYTTTHNRSIHLPVTTDIKNVVEKELGGTCTTDCAFSVNYQSLTLVDGSKTPLSGDLTVDGSFDALVTKLSTVDSKAFDKSKLQPEATAVTSGSQISWGYFDLHGGSATAIPLICLGKFDPDQSKPFFQFPDSVIVSYLLTGGGYLRVTDSTDHYIPLAGPNVFIKVDNEIGSSTDHFQEYAKLSTMNPTLPSIIHDLQGTCKPPLSGGVPGCTDAQWP